tara:strand:+ start:243 stop:845 length:603 start_codon:yes stop_codon:yes gene_type:complete
MSPLAFGIGKSRGAQFDPAIFYCNLLQFYWHWTNGKDFDLRASFIRPTQLAGQIVGTDKLAQIVDGGGSITYMKWGGDNQDDTEGYEGIYIDVNAIKQVPGGLAGNIIELDLRGSWYAEVGTNPVFVRASGYDGGTMTLERDTSNVSGYGFINTGYATSFTNYKESNGTVVTSVDREGTGQRLARATIDLNTYQITFFEN